MISNEDKKIEDLIKDAYNEKVWLPEFQRPFVWDNSQVRLLVDSLYHNYTISSILSWRGKNELARRRVGGSVNDIQIPSNKNEDENIIYLLDGQQRTTALTYVFTDKKVYKGNRKTPLKPINLYWDSEYKGDEVEKRWIFDDEKIYITNDEIVELKNVQEDELFKKYQTRFIKLKDIFINDNNKIINKLSKTPELLGDYLNKIQTLKDNILNRKVVEIEQKGELNTVLEVFERINTKNTKLSIFDIMVAKTYKKYDEGYFTLRDFLKIVYSDNLRKPNSDYFKNHVDDFRSQDVFDEPTLLYFIMVIISQKFKANEVLKITTDDLIDNIKNIHFILNRLTEIMERDFYIEKAEQNKYQPVAKFIVAFLTRYSNVYTQSQYRAFLLKWYWNTIIYNRYPGAQNERIERDFQRLNNNSNNLIKVLDLMSVDNSRSFVYIEDGGVDNLFNCYYDKKNDQIYKAMLVVLKSRGINDIYSGVTPTKNASKTITLEEHHIFPIKSQIGRELAKKYKNTQNENILNNIANIMLITKETNNKKIGNKNPKIYIKEFRENNKEDDFYKWLETHFISKDMVDDLLRDDFEEFIIKRTKLIYEYIIGLAKIENIS